MNKLLNRVSLANKMLLIFVGCVILPLATQNFFYYSHTEKNIQIELLQRMSNILEDKANKIKGNLSGVVTLSRNYNNNVQLYRYLDKHYNNNMSYFIAYQDELNKLIVTDLTNHFQIKRIMLYTNNPTLFSGAFVRKLNSCEEESLEEELLDLKHEWIGEPDQKLQFRVALEPTKLRATENRSLSFIRTIDYYPQYSNYKKTLRIDLNEVYLTSMLSESNLFDNMILVDSDNRVLISANTYETYGTFDIFKPDELRKSIVVLEKPISDFPLTLYGFYDSKMISDQFRKDELRIFSSTIVVVLFASICIFFVARNITKRTRLVVNQSKQIAQGKFIQIETTGMGTDEISILEKSMNQMSVQLQKLIDKEYTSKLIQSRLERETTQAKLLALQSQVNPHFMFNALESIRLKALAKQESETATMIKYMSRMFRHLINWDEDIICLQEDMKFLNEYLSVQKYRFEDEFAYHIEVEEAAKICLLPKLIIQPLVENACKHGLEVISNFKEVLILAIIEGEWLKIKVEDNGGGMSPERLEELKNMLHNEMKFSSNVGLYNVYQRLVLYYGDKFSFEIDSIQGKGTICDIKIPVKYN